MPRYVVYNTTRSRVFVPGANVWVDGQKNKVVDVPATDLNNSDLNALVIKDILRISGLRNNPAISDSLEIPTIDFNQDGTGLDPGLGSDGIGSINPDSVRQSVPLNGVIDGVNTVFTAPETFVQDPPGQQIALYLNGQRLILTDDYGVSGGGAGEGTTVTLVIAPVSGDKVQADYYLVP